MFGPIRNSIYRIRYDFIDELIVIQYAVPVPYNPIGYGSRSDDAIRSSTRTVPSDIAHSSSRRASRVRAATAGAGQAADTSHNRLVRLRPMSENGAHVRIRFSRTSVNADCDS